MNSNILAILLLISTMASLVGCVSIEEPGTSDATQVTYQIGSSGKAEDFEFGVNEINSFELTTEYGETFQCLLVNITYTNLSEKEQDITKRNIEFYLDNEEIKPYEFRYEFEGLFEEGNLFNDNSVKPGRTKRGYIIYRIYKDYSKIDVCLNGINVSSTRDVVKPISRATPTQAIQSSSVSSEQEP